MELVDTSALVLARRHRDVRTWLLDNGSDVAINDLVALEYLAGARSGEDYVALERALEGFHRIPIEAADWVRARGVHRSLAFVGAGHQRRVRLPDLLIAAVAERHAMPIVHYDEDYDRIANITGQPTRWISPRGSLQGRGPAR
jgi:predicted nucleic acid-binding protein